MKMKLKLTLLAVGLSALSACTSYATTEELKQLDDTKAKTTKLDTDRTQLIQEKKKTEQEVTQKKQKLEQARKEKDEVLKRLQEIEKK